MAKYLGPLKILLLLQLTENTMGKQAHPWMYIYIYLSSLGRNLMFLIMFGCTHTDRQVFSLSPSPCGDNGTGGDEHGQPLGDRASTIDMGLALGPIVPRPATGLNILEGSRISKKEYRSVSPSAPASSATLPDFSFQGIHPMHATWVPTRNFSQSICFIRG